MNEIISELKGNPIIQRTMKWDGKQGGTYEDFWRNFLNQNIPKSGKRIINLNKVSELGGGVTTSEIGLSFPMKIANILEAEKNSGALDYTGSRGPESVMNMLITMLNSKCSDEVFCNVDVMRTGGGTEAITLLLKYFKNKKILQLGPGYFMQYLNGCKIDTLFNKDLLNDKKGVFSMLPSLEDINKKVKFGDILWIIQPGISGEYYSQSDLFSIFSLAKEKKCYVVVDTAFDGTQINKSESGDIFEVTKNENYLDKTIFFGSPSKGQGYPGKRLGFLATKNKEIINSLLVIAGENRDGLSLNIESNAMYTFLEIFDQEILFNPKLNIGLLIDNIFKKYDPFGNIFSSIRSIIDDELINKYLKWKDNFFSVMKKSLIDFQKEVGSGDVFSGISGDIKSLFNIFLKIRGDISVELMKKYDINEIVRYMFLYNGILIAPGQNFGGNKDFWQQSSIILRGTLTGSPIIAINKTKDAINFLLNNNL